jgi:hypothetical protein
LTVLDHGLWLSQSLSIEDSMPNGTSGAPDAREFALSQRMGEIAADPETPAAQVESVYDVFEATPLSPAELAAAKVAASSKEMKGWKPAFDKRGLAKAQWALLKQGVKHFVSAAAGVRTKPLEEQYKIEALDPLHRMADALNPLHIYFNDNYDSSLKFSRSVFFDWINYAIQYHAEWVKHFLKEAKVSDVVIAHFLNRGVVAYHATSPLAQLTTRITFKGGKMYRLLDKVFSTTGMSTAWGGSGWAIYVVSDQGHWFCSNHRVGMLHHSSLLGGRPVLSAGEIKVIDGLPHTVTAKSGHYRPKMEHFVNGLRCLAREGINLTSVKVVVFDKKTAVTDYTAAQLLDTPSLQSRYTGWEE